MTGSMRLSSRYDFSLQDIAGLFRQQAVQFHDSGAPGDSRDDVRETLMPRFQACKALVRIFRDCDCFGCHSTYVYVLVYKPFAFSRKSGGWNRMVGSGTIQPYRPRIVVDLSTLIFVEN